jgi:DNA-binding transcriptional regulator LsrR (DeoR family)
MRGDVMSKYFDKSLIPKLAETYLQDKETLLSVSRKYRISDKTVRKYLLQVEDEELLIKVKA